MKIRLGIPAYGGLHGHTVRSLMLTYHLLQLLGYEVEADFVIGSSAISKCRNEITNRFWNAGEDILIFLDADMVWKAIDIVRLIETGKDCVCGNYRVKTDQDKWVCYPEPTEDHRPIVVDGLIKTWDAGTGFLLIRRNVIARMREAYPNLRYTDSENKEIYALFEFVLEKGKFWGEDYTFSARWGAIGGEIWMLPDVTLEHIGVSKWIGNYHEYLLERGRQERAGLEPIVPVVRKAVLDPTGGETV